MPRRRKKIRGEVYAKYKAPEFKTLPPQGGHRRGDELVIRSVGVEVGKHDTYLKERNTYSGSLVKGIATMHKSNAVPVIDEEQATDIARMRRS